MEFKEKELRELVDQNFTAYTTEEGRPTCEFSSGEKNMTEKIKILFESDKRLEAFDSHWVVFRCDTCKGYNKKTPIHFMIADERWPIDYEGMEWFKK